MFGKLQSNLNTCSSITDGSFTIAFRTLFWFPAKFSLYIGFFSVILSCNCMLCVLIRIASSRRFKWVYSTYNYCVERRKDMHKLSPFVSWPGVMINFQWLEQPVSRTHFHGPKAVWAIEARLYLEIIYLRSELKELDIRDRICATFKREATYDFVTVFAFLQTSSLLKRCLS